jgi:hypothetical protein
MTIASAFSIASSKLTALPPLRLATSSARSASASTT